MRTIAGASAALLAAAIAPTAEAVTANASITVSATVVSSCSVTGGAIAFGAYTPGTSASQDGTITVNCSPGTAYSVALDEGQAGDATARRMSGPAGARLAYDLYRDPARSARWRDGASAASGVGNGSSQAIPVHASIEASAGASAGGYSDTVTATLTY